MHALASREPKKANVGGVSFETHRRVQADGFLQLRLSPQLAACRYGLDHLVKADGCSLQLARLQYRIIQ